MKKIVVIIGTRPEAIKMAPLILELKKNPIYRTIVISTGQHKEMLNEVLNFFSIAPDYALSVFRDQQSLSMLTTNLIAKIEPILIKENPSAVIVHGDTASAFSGALVAYYLRIKVFHVEAGLRTDDIYSPHPEEYFRKTIDSISVLLFAPTQANYNNLIKEGISEDKIFITGNTIADTFKFTLGEESSNTNDNLVFPSDKKLILFTMHRRENIGTPMHSIFSAIKDITSVYRDILIVFPMHPNPAIKVIADNYLLNTPRILLIQPLPFQQLHKIIADSWLIMTDSGGIQEEAAILGKSIFVLRESTERSDIIKEINGILISPNKESLVREFDTFYNKNFSNITRQLKNDRIKNKGSVSEKIIKIIGENIIS